LTERYPEFTIVPGNSHHNHAFLATERALEEWCMYLMAREDVGRLASGGHGKAYIYDVGGNPLRHHRRGRRDIWCVSPVLSAQDVDRAARNQARIPPSERRWCEHTIQDCTCAHEYHEPDGSTTVYTANVGISVQSLYYLPAPGTADGCVIDIVHRFTTRTFYAWVHDFDRTYGTFGPGERLPPEAHYQYYPDGPSP